MRVRNVIEIAGCNLLSGKSTINYICIAVLVFIFSLPAISAAVDKVVTLNSIISSKVNISIKSISESSLDSQPDGEDVVFRDEGTGPSASDSKGNGKISAFFNKFKTLAIKFLREIIVSLIIIFLAGAFIVYRIGRNKGKKGQ